MLDVWCGPGRVVGWMLLGCLVVGCSAGDVASLSGRVTLDGEPMDAGTIRLLPQSGTPGHGAGAQIVNGRYDMPANSGLMAGEYTVMISATRPATAAEVTDDGQGKPDPDEEEHERDAAPRVQLIPAKYNVATTLRATVTKGSNTQDFDLER